MYYIHVHILLYIYVEICKVFFTRQFRVSFTPSGAKSSKPSSSPFRKSSPCSYRAMQGHDVDESFDLLFKIVLIGDAGVGKTCVVQRFKSGTFFEKQSNTIGVDFTMKSVTIEDKKVKVRLKSSGDIFFRARDQLPLPDWLPLRAPRARDSPRFSAELGCRKPQSCSGRKPLGNFDPGIVCAVPGRKRVFTQCA